MQIPYKVIAIVINCEGATEALVVQMPTNFEEILEDEKDYVKNKVENLGCEYLTHFSQVSEFISLSESVQIVLPQTSTKVKHWNTKEIEQEGKTLQQFQMDITDNRKANGQVFVDLGNVDDCLSVIIEVSKPTPEWEDTQTVHIGLDNGDNILSLYKCGSGFILEPNGEMMLGDIWLERGHHAYKLDVE
jgi:hypothetical protein